jgi:hypothetical protein
MPLCLHHRRVLARTVVLGAVTGVITGLIAPAAAAGTAPGPNLVKGSAYLVSPASLIGGHYYRSFGHAADFGLTIDGALALAATGDDNRALRKIVTFIAGGGRDAAGKTINYWTGIGTRYASGGAIAKEALLAEVAGENPRHFGGQDLIAALNASICTRAAAGGSARCPAAGSYTYAGSVFDQALGVMAQLRAGQRRQAARPVAYLESLQNEDGSFPSLLPGSGRDVDSTAIAVMALRLAAGPGSAAVRSGVAWIASRQEHDGGFPGAGGDSVNSAGLAIQALTLRRADYRSRIAAAEEFLAREQNPDGGFSAAAGSHSGSNLRASTQAVGGATGISFGSLRRDLSRPASSPAGQGSAIAYLIALPALALALAAAAAVVLLRRRQRRRGPAGSDRDQADRVGGPVP